jgi:hypothetical protein
MSSSCEVGVTEGGDIALSFDTGISRKPDRWSFVLCDRESAMALTRDILRAVALSDALGDVPETDRREMLETSHGPMA